VEYWQTGVVVATGGVERSVVELDTDDRKHDDREQNEKTDLKERRHRLQDTLENDLQTFQTPAPRLL